MCNARLLAELDSQRIRVRSTESVRDEGKLKWSYIISRFCRAHSALESVLAKASRDKDPMMLKEQGIAKNNRSLCINRSAGLNSDASKQRRPPVHPILLWYHCATVTEFRRVKMPKSKPPSIGNVKGEVHPGPPSLVRLPPISMPIHLGPP